MQPAVPSTQTSRRETLNIRVPVDERNLIDRAAHAQGKTRADFIRYAARRAAEEALLDQAILQVSPEIYAEFAARLEAPPLPSDQLRKTMQCRQPWDPS